MTDHELADLICGRDAWTVSMSKAGVFLRVGESHHEITERQAEIVWNAILFPPVTRPLQHGASK